jgi:hypothetical protein
VHATPMRACTSCPLTCRSSSHAHDPFSWTAERPPRSWSGSDQPAMEAARSRTRSDDRAFSWQRAFQRCAVSKQRTTAYPERNFLRAPGVALIQSLSVRVERTTLAAEPPETDTEMRSRRRWWIGGLILSALLIGLVAATVGLLLNHDDESVRTAAAPAKSQPARIDPAHAAAELTIPCEPISLDDATGQAPFDVLMPDTERANAQNLQFACVLGRAVELRFPGPVPEAGPVRQDYLLVWQAPWRGGDPQTAFTNHIKQAAIAGESMCLVRDLPAVCVEAHSPDDETRSNPAFVRVVIDNIELEISGGENLDDLLDMAASLRPATTRAGGGAGAAEGSGPAAEQEYSVASPD